MIAIINTAVTTMDGMTEYRLQINDKLIAEFYHNRSDGLAACLRIAADAADRAHYENIERLIKLAGETPE